MNTELKDNMATNGPPEPPVTATSHSEPAVAQVNVDEGGALMDLLDKEKDVDDDEEDEEEEEEEQEEEEEKEEVAEQKKPKKKRRGRAKARRRGKPDKTLVDAQAAAAAFTFMRKRRQDLTLGAKIMVLDMLEQVPKVPQGKIASMFQVSQSQVSRIMKNKEAIMAQWNQFAAPDRKRCRLGKAGALEQKLVDWYREAKKEDLPISGPILMEKAKSIGHEMGIDFKPSAGWLGRWKDRNGVVLKRFKDKDGAPSITKTSNHWRRYMFTKATKDYSLDNVWIVDETIIAYNALPAHLGCERVNDNDKVSVVLACNLAGTERRPPFIIGNSQKLTSVNLPVPFQHNSESAVTLDLFSSWLKEWDRELHTKRKKIVLLMSKRPYHPENPHTFNINITFFPPDTSPVLQPLQLGVINVFKSLYRHQQLSYVLAIKQASENIEIPAAGCSLPLLDVIFMIHKAWKHVSPETIVKCVVKAGMSKDVDALNVCDSIQAPPGVSQEVFEVLVDVDVAPRTMEHEQLPPESVNIPRGFPSDTQFSHYHESYGNSGNKTQPSVPQSEVSVSEAVYACQILRRYVQNRGGKLYDEYTKLESSIYSDMILEGRPDLRNNYHPDPLHHCSSVHSLEAHKVALEQKNEYLKKMHDELHQQKTQREMKKVTHSSVVLQNPQSSIDILPQEHLPSSSNVSHSLQEARPELHPQVLETQRPAMLGHDIPQQEVVRQNLHHPVQHPNFVRQDFGRPEYRHDSHQDRSRPSLVELRSLRQPHSDLRNEPRNYGKSDSMVTLELKNLSSDGQSVVEIHHHGIDVDHAMRQPDARMDNSAMPYYTLPNALPHYMHSK